MGVVPCSEDRAVREEEDTVVPTCDDFRGRGGWERRGDGAGGRGVSVVEVA